MATSTIDSAFVDVTGARPRRLQSFARGQWVEGTGRATPLFHAVTGVQIPLHELRYWSVERQEAYVDAEASLQAEGR